MGLGNIWKKATEWVQEEVFDPIKEPIRKAIPKEIVDVLPTATGIPGSFLREALEDPTGGGKWGERALRRTPGDILNNAAIMAAILGGQQLLGGGGAAVGTTAGDLYGYTPPRGGGTPWWYGAGSQDPIGYGGTIGNILNLFGGGQQQPTGSILDRILGQPTGTEGMGPGSQVLSRIPIIGDIYKALYPIGEFFGDITEGIGKPLDILSGKPGTLFGEGGLIGGGGGLGGLFGGGAGGGFDMRSMLVPALLAATAAGGAGLLGGGEGRAKAEAGIAGAGGAIGRAGELLPGEEQALGGAFGMGQNLSDILAYRMGMGERPTGYMTPEEQYMAQGPMAQSLYGQVSREAADPFAFYTSTLTPQLQAAEDYINRAYQQKGLLRSGLPIEQMGRAGVELAIREAESRMAHRGTALERARGLQETIGAGERGRLADIASLYGMERGYGAEALQRQLGAVGAQAPYTAYPYQARLGDIYGRRAAGYAFPGQAISALGLALSGGQQPVINIPQQQQQQPTQPYNWLGSLFG